MEFVREAHWYPDRFKKKLLRLQSAGHKSNRTKYNFNDDKSSNQVFGLTSGCESWEFRNNVSPRVLFQSADFSDSSSSTGWPNDFESRYPKDYTDVSKLKRVFEWVVSTNREAATGKSISAVTYNGKRYNKDTADYRLAKFKSEFDKYFVKTPMLFYYLFTEIFLMVDSRAKNLFLSTFNGTHWLPLPYDMDTALGINNEGALAFDYDLEDTDLVDGDTVFNGQKSVLWNNVRDAFKDEIAQMYKDLRTEGTLSYDVITKKFTDHQSVWPEALWNEDAYEKYIEPLESDNDGSYLGMLQGNKASQRDWWLFNAFRYRDSKYHTGDAVTNRITIRCYAAGDITVTPYSHIWPAVEYGSYLVTERGKRNEPFTLNYTVDAEMNDTETYIYSADRVADVGDLSPLVVGYADFHMAVKLQQLILGSDAAGYKNHKLEYLNVGNNELLSLLNIRNCTALTTAPDLSGCASIETVLAGGSSISGLVLPNGGHLKTLELPASLANFAILNQKQVETVTFEGYDSLNTLRVEGTPNIPIEDIVLNAPNLNRVRLINIEWDATDEAALESTIARLSQCIGMDSNEMNTEKAVVTGRVYVDSLSEANENAILTLAANNFPELTIVVGDVPHYAVRYLNHDNSIVYIDFVEHGEDAVDPIAVYGIAEPIKAGTDDIHYDFYNWGELPTNMQGNKSVVAQYTTLYAVRYYGDGDALLQEQWVVEGESVVYTKSKPTKSSTAQYTYTFSGWDIAENTNGLISSVTKPTNVIAMFTAELRYYNVYFRERYPIGPNHDAYTTRTLQTSYVPYGGSAVYEGETPVKTNVYDGSTEWTFTGWDKSTENITDTTYVYAQFTPTIYEEEIVDTWEDIRKNVANGTWADKYKIGNYKPLELGDELGTVNMQIVAVNADPVVGSEDKAPLTWVSIELPPKEHVFNLPSQQSFCGHSLPGLPEYEYEETEIPSWIETTYSDFRQWSVNSDQLTRTVAIATFNIETTSSGTMDLYLCGHWASRGMLVMEAFRNGYRLGFGYDEDDIQVKSECSAGDIFDVTIIALNPYGNASDNYGNFAINEFGSNPASYVIRSCSIQPFQKITSYVKGTGTAGGWEWSELRRYLSADVYPSIPTSVSAQIKPSARVYNTFDTGSFTYHTTSDLLWIPSYFNVAGTWSANSAEKPEVYYAAMADKLLKKTPSDGSGSDYYHLSTIQNVYQNNRVRNGTVYRSTAYISALFPIGFCTGADTIQDSWEQIFASIDDGTYKTKYSIGDTKVIDLGSEGKICAQIAAFDADELADGSGYAPITWICEQLLNTSKAMNSTSTAIGGWAESAMRTYLNDTIKPLIPESIRGRIKTVVKQSCEVDADGNKIQQTTNDDVWIPSDREVSNDTTYETSGAVYSTLFTDNESRKKQKYGASGTAALWLRSAASSSRFRNISYAGTTGTGINASNSFGVALGFCT